LKLALELRAGVEALGLELYQSQYDQLLQFLYLLEKWNKSYNLTAIKGLEMMLSYHLLDSLSIYPVLKDCRKAVDVGSGAGLPGIPLAIAMPDTHWILIDSNSKKTRFIQQALAHCGIKNVQVVQIRVQDYHAADSIDVIVSRAYASLADFCASVEHLLDPGTCLLTMKTEMGTFESGQIDTSRFELEETKLEVPGIEEQRSLVTLRLL
jgi:16S rRNA (guanine527-N7)-methyltransferase